MSRVWLSLGSNQDRERHISSALDMLAQEFGELVVSSVFESESVGFSGDPFYNLVVGIETDLSVGQLSARLRDIEDANGRTREGPKFSGRTLDIDILTYDQNVGDIDGVNLPRAEITRNAYVLWPLAEVAPQEEHPLEEKTYQVLWQAYDRDQKLWPVDFVWQGRRISEAR